VKGRKRSSSVHGVAQKAITRTPRKIVGRLAEQIEVSNSTVREICREALSLFPHNMQLSQSLSKDGIARRYAFAREYGALLENSPCVLNVTWFSDEERFHLYTIQSEIETFLLKICTNLGEQFSSSFESSS
jgi:hypothetical protein